MELKLLRNKKKRRPLRYMILCAVFVVFIVSAFFVIRSNNKQIKVKTQELNAIKNELSIQEIKNSEVELRSKYLDDEQFKELFISEEARKLDYVKQSERVFIITAGN